MAIANTETSQAPMVDSRFKTAAFMSFIGPILGITAIAAGFKQSAALIFLLRLPLAIVLLVFSIYVTLQLKRLIVERHHLHNMSNLINYILILNIYMYASAILTSIYMIFTQDPGAFALFQGIQGILFIPGFLLGGIIEFIFGLRLLNVKDLKSDLYRTYAIISIIDGACKFTIILLSISMLSSVVSSVVLGIIFLKESETEPEVEFV